MLGTLLSTTTFTCTLTADLDPSYLQMKMWHFLGIRQLQTSLRLLVSTQSLLMLSSGQMDWLPVVLNTYLIQAPVTWLDTQDLMVLQLLKELIGISLGWELARTLLMQSTQTRLDTTWLPSLLLTTGSLLEDIDQIFTKSPTLTQELPVDVTEYTETFAVFNTEQISTTLDLLLPPQCLDRLLRAILLLARLWLLLRLMLETRLSLPLILLLTLKWALICSISWTH